MAAQKASSRSLVWLRDSRTPVFVLNAQRRVVLFNRGCEELSGWEVADVLGQRALAASSSESAEVQSLLMALAPPAEVWQGTPQRVLVCWPHRTAEPANHTIEFWPLLGPDGGVLHVLGIVCSETAVVAAPPTETIAQRCHRELAWLRHELKRRFGERTLVGRSPEMLRVFDQLKLAREATIPVSIVGEPGTGKEAIARSIHERSGSARRAFVVLDCRDTPAVELKRVLRSALTESKSEAPDSSLPPGTCYLSHAEELPADVQARMLEVWPTTFSASSVRIITSSTQRLDAEFLVEKFAPELACRLSPLVIELPPLRRRGDDLLLLAQHFLEARNREAEAQVTGWDAEVAQQWLRYRWPGNLDELREVINEAHASSQDGLVHVAQLPFRFRAGVEAQRLTPSRRQTRPLDELLERVEREELETALQEAGGQMTRAAELLKIPRARLYRRLEQLGLRTGESTAPPLDSSPESG